MKKSKALLVGMGVLLSLLLAGGAMAADKLKIGVTGAMTGPWAVWGLNLKEGALIAADEVNKAGGILGRQVEIVISDDGANPNQSMQEMKRLVESVGIECVVGPSTTGAAMMVNPWLGSVAKIPQLMASASGTNVPADKWPYCFKLIYSDERKIALTVSKLKEKKIVRIGVLYQNDQWGINLKDYMDKAMKANSLSPVGVEAFEKGAMDVTGQLQKVASANPEIIMALCMDPEFSTVIKTANKLGIVKLFWGQGSTISMSAEELLPKEVFQKYRDHIIAVNSERMTYSTKSPLAKKTEDLLKSVEQKFGVQRRAFDNVSAAYDAIHFAKLVFEKAGKTNSEAFKQVVEAGVQYSGVLTDYKFSPQEHMADVNIVLIKISDDKRLESQGISQRYEW